MDQSICSPTFNHADPTNAEALTGKEVVLAQLERYDEALAALQAALAINPKQATALETVAAVTQIQQQLEMEQQQMLSSPDL